MKKALYFLTIILLVIAGCNNQDGTLEGDVEIPVSVEDIQLKSIEEFVSTTGTVFPIVDIELPSEISGDYFLEKNPRTGRQWQLGDRISKGELIARIEDEEYVNSIKLELQQLNLELAESEMKKLEATI